jgi:hypothetical protein
MNIVRVSDADMSTHALSVALASEDTEGECHFLEHPLPVGGEGWVLWYAWQGDT